MSTDLNDPISTIIVNDERYEVTNSLALHAQMLRNEWGPFWARTISDLAFTWMIQMQRDRCAIAYNHGNGSLRIAKAKHLL